MLIIAKVGVEPRRIGFGKTIELFARINANPVHDHKKNRTSRRTWRGFHIAVILQNVHSIFSDMVYK